MTPWECQNGVFTVKLFYLCRKKSPKPIFLDENATSGLWKWRCSKHATKKDNCCRAQIATIDNLFVLKDSLCYTHSHLPDFKSTKKQLIRERIREIATNHPTMKPIELKHRDGCSLTKLKPKKNNIVCHNFLGCKQLKPVS